MFVLKVKNCKILFVYLFDRDLRPKGGRALAYGHVWIRVVPNGVSRSRWPTTRRRPPLRTSFALTHPALSRFNFERFTLYKGGREFYKIPFYEKSVFTSHTQLTFIFFFLSFFFFWLVLIFFFKYLRSEYQNLFFCLYLNYFSLNQTNYKLGLKGPNAFTYNLQRTPKKRTSKPIQI